MNSYRPPDTLGFPDGTYGGSLTPGLSATNDGIYDEMPFHFPRQIGGAPTLRNAKAIIPSQRILQDPEYNEISSMARELRTIREGVKDSGINVDRDTQVSLARRRATRATRKVSLETVPEGRFDSYDKDSDSPNSLGGPESLPMSNNPAVMAMFESLASAMVGAGGAPPNSLDSSTNYGKRHQARQGTTSPLPPGQTSTLNERLEGPAHLLLEHSHQLMQEFDLSKPTRGRSVELQAPSTASQSKHQLANRPTSAFSTPQAPLQKRFVSNPDQPPSSHHPRELTTIDGSHRVTNRKADIPSHTQTRNDRQPLVPPPSYTPTSGSSGSSEPYPGGNHAASLGDADRHRSDLPTPEHPKSPSDLSWGHEEVSSQRFLPLPASVDKLPTKGISDDPTEEIQDRAKGASHAAHVRGDRREEAVDDLSHSSVDPAPGSGKPTTPSSPPVNLQTSKTSDLNKGSQPRTQRAPRGNLSSKDRERRDSDFVVARDILIRGSETTNRPFENTMDDFLDFCGLAPIRGGNHWNFYQGLWNVISASEEAETGKKGCGQCYNHRLAQYGEEKWKQIIMDMVELHKMDSPPQTVGHLRRDWDKFENRCMSVLKDGAAHNFHAFMIVVGGNPVSDGDLAAILPPPAFPGLLDDKVLCLSGEEFVALFRSHVFTASAQQLYKLRGQNREEEEDLADTRPKIFRCLLDATGEESSCKISGQQAHAHVRFFMANLLRMTGLLTDKAPITLGGKFYIRWHDLGDHLLEKGLKFINWPADVRFPCEFSKPGNGGTTRQGGKELTAQENKIFFCAIYNEETCPYIEETQDKEGQREGRVPLIVTAAPAWDSKFARGRSLFRDEVIRDDGLPRSPQPPEKEEEYVKRKGRKTKARRPPTKLPPSPPPPEMENSRTTPLPPPESRGKGDTPFSKPTRMPARDADHQHPHPLKDASSDSSNTYHEQHIGRGRDVTQDAQKHNRADITSPSRKRKSSLNVDHLPSPQEDDEPPGPKSSLPSREETSAKKSRVSSEGEKEEDISPTKFPGSIQHDSDATASAGSWFETEPVGPPHRSFPPLPHNLPYRLGNGAVIPSHIAQCALDIAQRMVLNGQGNVITHPHAMQPPHGSGPPASGHPTPHNYDLTHAPLQTYDFRYGGWGQSQFNSQHVQQMSGLDPHSDGHDSGVAQGVRYNSFTRHPTPLHGDQQLFGHQS